MKTEKDYEGMLAFGKKALKKSKTPAQRERIRKTNKSIEYKLKTEKEIAKIVKEFENKLNKYKKYTWEELNKFKEMGIEGEVCFCKIQIANTMTLECVNCGKVQPQFAKRYIRRKLK
ncbi:MAG: hypothetical protein KAJ49_03345 [Arcobacteraceae bacterium]|nr:hypothetical protein [Arcobacteraceae bacterium]